MSFRSNSLDSCRSRLCDMREDVRRVVFVIESQRNECVKGIEWGLEGRQRADLPVRHTKVFSSLI